MEILNKNKRSAMITYAFLSFTLMAGGNMAVADVEKAAAVAAAAELIAKAAAAEASRDGARPEDVATAAKRAAEKKADDLVDVMAKAKKDAENKKQNEIRPDGFQFSFGTKLLNPYTLQSQGGTNYLLSNRNDTEVDPYLELSYRNSWAVSHVLKKDSDQKSQGGFLRIPFSEINNVTNWWSEEDFFQQDIALGFVIRNSSDPLTEQSGNAIAGSGDFYLNYNTDLLPLYRSVGDVTAKQFSLSSGFSLVTDRSFQDVHPNAFLGASFEIAFKWPSPEKVGLLTVRGGYGWIDSPQISGGTTNIIVGASQGLPQFKLEGAPMVSAQAMIPFADGVFFTAGGQVFVRDTPSPWSLSIGLTLSMDKLNEFKNGLFGSLVSDDDK